MTSISFLTPKFLTTFLFGFLLVILYAKDKFNMPTYDRESMGPFAQLPPQSLTIDVRYRQGRMWYVVLMLCLYTAISFVGPTTFYQELQSATSQLDAQFQWGLQFKEPEIWPVAAATFLVGAGAARDNSILGRIELFVRQYAHKTAYIPRAVGDLAYSLRNLNVAQWLASNPFSGEAEKTAREKELKEREDALSALIGPELLREVKQAPQEESERSSWVRANILFYTLQQIFNKRSSFVTPRLEYLVDVPENSEIFERLRRSRTDLRARFPAAEGAALGAADQGEADKTFTEVQRFLKDTSLMIAVLLAQSARNPIHLNDRLDQLGFEGVDLRDRAGHLAYALMVVLSIMVGAVLALAVSYVVLVALPPIRDFFSYTNEVGTHFGNALAPVGSSVIAYIVAFRLIDYLRDRSLDSLDWREGPESYVKTGFSASMGAGLTSLLLINVLFSLAGFGLWRGFVDLIYAIVLQTCLAAITVGFTLYYLRHCARSEAPKNKLRAALASPGVWVHAVVAAATVAMMNGLISIHQVRSGPASSYEVALNNLRPVYDQLVSDEKPREAGTLQTDVNAVGNELAALGLIGCVAAPRPALGAPPQNGVSPTAAGADASGAASGSTGPGAPVPCGNRLQVIDQIKARVLGICASLNKSLLGSESPSCASGRGSATNAGQQAVLKFTGALDSLSNSVNTLEYLTTSNKLVQFAMTFSAIIAFFMALAYGIGFQVARWMWLYADASRADGQFETLRQQDGRFSEDRVFAQFLRTPIPALNAVTPLEAVHYEDYRIKLYSLLKRRSLNLDKLLAPAPAPAGPVRDASQPA